MHLFINFPLKLLFQCESTTKKALFILAEVGSWDELVFKKSFQFKGWILFITVYLLFFPGDLLPNSEMLIGYILFKSDQNSLISRCQVHSLSW